MVFRNAPLREEYDSVLQALRPVLDDLPSKIIAIDGRPGAGKTTLGRFLAWRFNATLLETDVLRIGNTGTFTYREDCAEAIIDHRIKSDRPIFVEGAVCLKLLQQLGRSPDFHIHLVCEEAKGSSDLETEWMRYESDFDSYNAADLTLTLPRLN